MKQLLRIFSNLKIKRKIQIFGIVSLLLLCTIFTVFYGSVASRTALDRAEEDISGDLGRIAKYLEDVDLAISSRLRHAGTSITIQQLLTARQQDTAAAWPADAILNDMCSVDQIQSVAIYTLDGTFVAGSGPEANEIQRPSEEVLRAVAQAEGNYWCDDAAYTGTRSDQLAVYRLICKDDKPLGVVRARIDLSALAALYTYLNYGGNSEVYLFSDKGNLLLPLELTSETLRAARDAFDDDQNAWDEQARIYTAQKGRYLVLSRPVSQFRLDVVDLASYERLMQDVRMMQTTILILGLICIVVQLAFFSAMGGFISRPIIALSTQMKQVGAGSLEVRCKNESRDEIGDLSRSFNQMLEQLQTLMQENEASEKKRHELELISLQLQISPHFMYNSLDSISALVQLGDTDGAFAMSQALSRFYRGVLSDGRCVIRLREELSIIESYLKIQSQRYQGGFDYTIDIEPELFDTVIVKLTLQPLVENAIYHGIRNVRRRGKIDITGRIIDGDMVLSVRDNGKGMAAERERMDEDRGKGDLILHRKGYGMYNADQRIKLYFGTVYGLHVRSVPDQWTQVDVHLPVCSYEEYGHDLSFDR